jgi:hypothetical protein
LHHLASHHRPGILVLAGHQIAVNDPVIRKGIASTGLAFELGTGPTELALWVVRGRLNTELL